MPQEFRDRLGEQAGRQRLMQSEGQLLLVLHSPPKPDEDQRQGRLYWRDAKGNWKPQGITHVEHAVGELLGEYERMADEIDSIEDDAADSEDFFEILTALGPMVRSSHNLHTVLQEAREAAPEDRALILLRDRAYALTRRLDLMQHDARTSLDFVIARRSEEQAVAFGHQAKASHRLNLLVALFFPIATMAGVFGMNLGNGLEGIDASAAPLPLLVVLSIGLAVGAGLAAFVARK